jgi:hypothetical protein
VIDDAMLGALSVRGSAAEVANALLRRYSVVADRVGFYLPYGHDDDLVAEIISAVRVA